MLPAHTTSLRAWKGKNSGFFNKIWNLDAWNMSWSLGDRECNRSWCQKQQVASTFLQLHGRYSMHKTSYETHEPETSFWLALWHSYDELWARKGLTERTVVTPIYHIINLFRTRAYTKTTQTIPYPTSRFKACPPND
jgi:hypothetical protein